MPGRTADGFSIGSSAWMPKQRSIPCSAELLLEIFRHACPPKDFEELPWADDASPSESFGKVAQIARYQEIYLTRCRALKKAVIVRIDGGCYALARFYPLGQGAKFLKDSFSVVFRNL